MLFKNRTRRRHKHKHKHTRNHKKTQHGGAIIIVVDKSKNHSIIENPIGGSCIVLDNLHSIRCISTDSYGSFVFIGELSPESNVLLQSQVRSNINRPLTQSEALSRPRNIILPTGETGKNHKKICIKVIFVGETQGRITSTEYRKEVTTEIIAAKEVKTQHKMYRQLISNGTGLNGAVIPDAIGSCMLNVNDFETMFTTILEKAKNASESGIKEAAAAEAAAVGQKEIISARMVKSRAVALHPDDKTRDVIQFISSQARGNNCSNIYISFIEYLEGFDALHINEGSVNQHQLTNIPNVAACVIAILLKTSCISLDMHPGNIMIHRSQYLVQIIDFGKIICFDEHDDDNATFNVKEWFLHYYEFCNTDKQRMLSNIFTPTSFGEYCDRIPSRLSFWNTHCDEEQVTHNEIKEIFDLLTFIGFIDCLYGFSKKREGQTIFLMQFNLVLNILFCRKADMPFLIEDIIKLRSNIENLKQWFTQSRNNVCKEYLIEIVKLLKPMICIHQSLGTPRDATSFEYSPNSPRFDDTDFGGGKAKKRRHVKRKTRHSRRKH